MKAAGVPKYIGMGSGPMMIQGEKRGDRPALRKYLQYRANLLLTSLQIPILQEHRNFTNLLHAIFYIRDELLKRTDSTKLLDTDRKHLKDVFTRVYELQVFRWLSYKRYLKYNDGFRLSLVMYINPSDPEAISVDTSS
jgi:hypothetical protein